MYFSKVKIENTIIKFQILNRVFCKLSLLDFMLKENKIFKNLIGSNFCTGKNELDSRKKIINKIAHNKK